MQIRKRYGSWAGITSLIRHLFFQESAALFGVESLVSLNSGWILAPPPPQLGAKVQWTAWTTAQGVLSTRTHSSFFCFFQTMMCHAQAGDIARLGTITTYYIFMGKECSVEHPPPHLGCRSYSYKFLWELPSSLLWCYIPPLPHWSCSLEFSFLFISLPSLQARFWHRHSDPHNPAHM